MTADTQIGQPGLAEDQAAVARGLYAAGFRGNDLLHIMATALRESSGGRPGATNNTSRPGLPGYHQPAPGAQPEYSVGPFQINLDAHPDISEADARDPDKAARYAYGLVYDTPQGFQHWSAHAVLTIEDFTAASRALIAAQLPSNWGIDNPVVPRRSQGFGRGASDPGAKGGPQAGQDKPSTIGNPLDALRPIGDAVGAVTARGFWPKIALTAAAVGLIGAGVFLYAQHSQTVRSAEGAAVKAAAA